jgi:hypothetical protein
MVAPGWDSSMHDMDDMASCDTTWFIGAGKQLCAVIASRFYRISTVCGRQHRAAPSVEGERERMLPIFRAISLASMEHIA